MSLQLSKPIATALLKRLVTVLIISALVAVSFSVENVSAYYTSGSLGRSLSVSPSFSINRDYLAPYGSACRSGQMLGNFAGVTIHETSNWSSGSNARMHALYLRDGGMNSEVSWHYSVDSSCAYQSIPESEKAWHAGDTGSGKGNAHTIAIEICDYSNDSNFDQAMANAEWLAADVLYRHGVYSVSGNLFQHHDFSAYGKNCPITIRDTNRWGEFSNKTQMYLDQMIEATGTFTLDDTGGDLNFSGNIPGSLGASRVDIYTDGYGWVGSSPTQNNSFTYKVDASIYTVGWHTLRFAAVRSDGSARWTNFAFLVGPDAQMCLESPSENETVYGGIKIKGWAVSHADISQVNIYAEDGSIIRSINELSERGDIETIVNSSGKYKDALHSGFEYTIDTGFLTNGPHVIRVEAVSNDGTKQTIIRSFTVGSGSVDTALTVNYQSHVQDIGWQVWTSNGAVSGTSGQAKRLEAMQIYLQNVDGGIEYRTHVQDIGWMNWVADGQLSGTCGQAKRLEAIQIRLTGAVAEQYDVYYRVHVQDKGWMDWAKNGDPSGTAGYGYRLEAIQIVLGPKGGAAPGSTSCPFIDRYPVIPSVSYQAHIQDIGWQGYQSNGTVAGTSGQSKRMEAIHIKLENMTGGIEYRTHVQDIGWMNWVSDNVQSGTSGLAKRLEAIEIRLTGAAAEQYDIYYRVHAQNIGWMDWAKNGESAGTAGFSYRLEAIQVVLIPKGGAAPGSTVRPFLQV